MIDHILKSIAKFIGREQLFKKDERLLIAASGGIDSMVLAAYCHQQQYDFILAHCNFGLRGKDSDLDEALVRETATLYQVPFKQIRFDTTTYANTHKISIQMAARALRYQWFDSIAKETKANYILTAHHRDDQVETMLLNLTKGSSISGLRGMLPKQNAICRPFIEISKEEIIALAKHWQISYRDDVSNESTKYQRNFLRHEIIPKLQTINPAVQESISRQATYLREVEQVFKSFIHKRLKKLVHIEANYQKTPIMSFLNHQYGRSLLFEYLHEYGFNSDKLYEIHQCLQAGISGKQFVSASHKLSCDRSFMYLSNLEEQTFIPVQIEAFTNSTLQIKNKVIHFSLVSEMPQKFDASNLCVYIDSSKLHLPLLIRPWKQGDYMYPLGMKMKKKKLSDLFSNQKIPVPQKQDLLVFESDKKIFFVEAIRVDERFKLQENTTEILKIEIKAI